MITDAFRIDRDMVMNIFISIIIHVNKVTSSYNVFFSHFMGM